MTVRMQEAEAAQDFSRFLDHLEAGDQVQLEREGKPSLLAEARMLRPLEEESSKPKRGSLEAAQAFFREWGPMLAEKEWVRAMNEAREVFNQPLEPRL